jgi:hypothetical protein
MIQRIQSIFLALVIILGVVFSFVPILTLTQGDSTFIMGAYKTINVELGISVAKNMGIGVLQGLVIIISALVIFLYKNRGLQMKLGKLNILLIAFQIAAMVMYSDSVKNNINTSPDEIVTVINFGAILPLISLILTYLAIHFIRKDDKLIRSADRLR